MSILTNHPEDSLTPSSGVLTIDATGALILPQGSDVQRPAESSVGQIRFSTASNRIEVYNGSAWTNLIDKSYVDLATADLQDQIDRIISNTDPIMLNSLSELVTDYQTANQDLQDQIAAEIGNRIAADQDLQGQIDVLANQPDQSSVLPIGSRGQVLFIKTTDTNEVDFDYVLNIGSFIENDSERVSAEETNPTLEEVFDTWSRFSHNETVNQPASLTDIAAWAFDSMEELVTSSNTTTYVGFYSPNSYDQYVHEVRLKSTHYDNDTIGILLAWYVDPNTGREYTLSALRSPGGVGFTWRVIYNYLRSDQQTIADGTVFVKWGNGSLGPNAAAANYQDSDAGWNAFPSGTKIKAIRDNDLITCQTTNLGEDAYLSNANLQINLASLPILSKFRGPRSYGYGAYSQAQSNFEVLDFPDIQGEVYDIRDGLVYANVNGVWTPVSGTSVVDHFGPGRLLYNKLSQKTYYTAPNGTIFKIGEVAEEVMILTIIDDQTVLTEGTAKYTFRAPTAITLTRLPRISLTAGSTLGDVVVDANVNGSSVFGANKLTIAADQKTSANSAVSVTLVNTNIQDDDEITVDVDSAGTNARGLKITLYYRK